MPPLTQLYGIPIEFIHHSPIRVRTPDRKARSRVFSPPFRSPRFRRRVRAGFWALASRPGRTGERLHHRRHDGYGLQDCLGEGGECGRAVADAWCAAEGRGAALSFGRAKGATTEPAYLVTCGD